MRFFECPYCRRRAVSLLDMSNSWYLLNPDKQCGHCLGRVGMVTANYLLFIFFAVGYIFGGLAVFDAVSELFPDSVPYCYAAFLAIGSVCIPYLMGSCFGLRLLLPKDNGREFRTEFPGHGHRDITEMPRLGRIVWLLAVAIFFLAVFLYVSLDT